MSSFTSFTTLPWQLGNPKCSAAHWSHLSPTMLFWQWHFPLPSSQVWSTEPSVLHPQGWGSGKPKYPGSLWSHLSPVIKSDLQGHCPVSFSQMKLLEPSSLQSHSINSSFVIVFIGPCYSEFWMKITQPRLTVARGKRMISRGARVTFVAFHVTFAVTFSSLGVTSQIFWTVCVAIATLLYKKNWITQKVNSISKYLVVYSLRCRPLSKR